MHKRTGTINQTHTTNKEIKSPKKCL